MRGKVRFPNLLFGATLRPESAGLAILLMLLLLIFLLLFLSLIAQPAQAQTYTVIHNFTDGADGSFPTAGLTTDAHGNFYGTTCGAPCVPGANSNGTVFRLSHQGSGWILTTLYRFRGGSDGAGPMAAIVFGADGSLYGTTYTGGGNGCGGTGCGTVFNLKPPASTPPNTLGGWTETVLYRFQGGSDGAYPELSELTFDQAGDIYGTTWLGGSYNQGTAFELTPSQGGWTESVLYTFTGGNDGAYPSGILAWNCGGQLESTTYAGGAYGNGTIFQLASSANGWTESVVYSFQGGTDGANPIGGDLPYCAALGTTCNGGLYGGGTAYMGHNTIFHHDFEGSEYPNPGPWAGLAGANGVLYGTTYGDGTYHYGSVFSLEGCAGWGSDNLHNFTGGQDGGNPIGRLVVQGGSITKIYGTAYDGGTHGNGVVFEITANGNDLSQCVMH